VDGQELEFTEGFTDLHTRVYEKTIKGEGFGIEDARPSIELVHTIRTSLLVYGNGTAHPFLMENKTLRDGMSHI
jgi:UDP-N-acetyl-2-amino-2-deoxyglucuronate dehydrogenase